MSHLAWLTISVGALVGTAMGGSVEAGRLETLWVDSSRQECTGAGPRECLRVRRSAAGEWELFYESIEGFDYEAGYTYEILVRVRERADPPADASSLTYELVEVRSKETVAEASPRALEAHPWQLSAFGDATAAVAEGNEATLEFDRQQSMAAGSAGCNRFAGTYESSAASLSFGLMRTTMMACPDDPRTLQEKAFLTALAAVEAFEISDGGLRLLDGGGTMLLTLVRRPDLPLIGPLWRATAINNGRQAVVSVLAETSPTATFTEEAVSGSGGCNQYHAVAELGEGTLAVSPAAASRKMCSEPEGVMKQEAWFLAALSTTATYEIDRQRLELRTVEGALAVAFEADDQ